MPAHALTHTHTHTPLAQESFLFPTLFLCLQGCVVDVQMQSGAAYQGVLKAVSPQLSVALALAHNKAEEATRENTEKLMQLEFADIVSVSVLPEANSSLSSKGEKSLQWV